MCHRDPRFLTFPLLACILVVFVIVADFCFRSYTRTDQFFFSFVQESKGWHMLRFITLATVCFLEGSLGSRNLVSDPNSSREFVESRLLKVEGKVRLLREKRVDKRPYDKGRYRKVGPYGKGLTHSDQQPVEGTCSVQNKTCAAAAREKFGGQPGFPLNPTFIYVRL